MTTRVRSSILYKLTYKKVKTEHACDAVILSSVYLKNLGNILFENLFVSLYLYSNCTVRQRWPIGQTFSESSIFSLTFIGFEKTSSYWAVQFVHFVSAVHWSPSIGKSRMTPVSFVKITES